MDTTLSTLEKMIWLNEKGYNLTIYEPGTKGSNIKWGYWKTNRQTVGDLISLVQRYPTYTNIGVICGEISNLLVLDFDSMTDYRVFASFYPAMLQTTRIKTGKGMHLWFTPTAFLPLHNDLCEVWYNSDRYASVPGNIHPSGAIYTLENDIEPKSVTIGELLNCGCKVGTVHPEGEEKSTFLDTSKNTFSLSLPAGDCPTNYPIPYGIYTRIKARLPIVEFLGIEELVRRGKDNWALCPYHNDVNPSLMVNLGTQRVSCFNPKCRLYSVDHKGLDIFDIVSVVEGCGRRRTAQILAWKLGL
jgi:hypothetical protein